MEKVFCVGDGTAGRDREPRVARLLEIMAKVCMGAGAEAGRNPILVPEGTLSGTDITDRDCSDTHHRMASSPVCRSLSVMLCRGRTAMLCHGRSVVAICRGKNAMAAPSCPRSPLSAGHCGLHRWRCGPPPPPSPLQYQPPPPPLRYLLPLLLLRCCPDPPPLQYRPVLWQ